MKRWFQFSRGNETKLIQVFHSTLWAYSSKHAIICLELFVPVSPIHVMFRINALSFMLFNEMFVPTSWQFWSSLLCSKINMVKSESHCKTKYPLKVVKQGPGKVSSHICSFPIYSHITNTNTQLQLFYLCPGKPYIIYR